MNYRSSLILKTLTKETEVLSIFSENLSESILQILQDKGLTYEAAANLCGFTSRHLSNIIRGRSSPSLEIFEKICVSLRQSPNDLLGLPSASPELASLIAASVIVVVDRICPDGSFITAALCPFCGAELEHPQFAFCPFCGQKLLWPKPSRH